MMGPGAFGGGMSLSPSAESILSNSTTGEVSPGRMEFQSSWSFMCLRWMFASSLPGFIMSMTSEVVPLDFFVFFDFGAGFGELIAFKPQVPHFEPIEGITMTNPSHLDMR